MKTPEPTATSPRKPRQRRITRCGLLKAAGSVFLAGSAAYGYGYFYESHHLVTEHITIPIPGLAARWHNKRLVQLSDLHAGRTAASHIQRAFQIAADLKPEMLLITGDFVDNAGVDPAEIADIIRPFAAQIPTLGSTGNHDFGHGFGDPDNAIRVCNALTRVSVRMLRNTLWQPQPGPGELCIAGIEDFWTNLFEPETLLQAPADASVIVLSHNPDSYEALSPFRFHLMLSGHTHGGQVRIPFWGPLILPIKNRERAAGLFHLDPHLPDRALYVTRGVGHILRIRLFCPPEITCITLRNPAMA